jgi:hypothetical protein
MHAYKVRYMIATTCTDYYVNAIGYHWRTLEGVTQTLTSLSAHDLVGRGLLGWIGVGWV